MVMKQLMVVHGNIYGNINLAFDSTEHMSLGMGFPTMWYVRPAKAQISLRVRAV